MDTQEYLNRIGIRNGDLSPDLEVLKLLQRQHLHSVPFENLDIHWGRKIELDIDAFYQKIVLDRRGGFCYELNGLFNELLRRIGYNTRLVSARVFRDDGSAGPEFDHAAIIVSLNDGEKYLADVGFGDFAVAPLRLILHEEQMDVAGNFLITPDGASQRISKLVANSWKGEYAFRSDERELSEFSEMCDYQQFSPDSHFRKGKVCSILTPNGRKTLTDSKFVISNDGVKQETPIDSQKDFYRILADEFLIVGPAANI